MDTACKWATVGIFVAVFFGLTWAAGCIQVGEFFGAIVVGYMAARLFYCDVCGRHSDYYAAG